MQIIMQIVWKTNYNDSKNLWRSFSYSAWLRWRRVSGEKSCLEKRAISREDFFYFHFVPGESSFPLALIFPAK